MPVITIEDFLADRQGRTFNDVVRIQASRFQDILEFFSDDGRQLRMEDSERHHDRPALAGVVRELENSSHFAYTLAAGDEFGLQRLRQAIGVVVRIIMEQRGWSKVGRRGSLGQKQRKDSRVDTEYNHNISGLSWWFCRVERYEKIGEEPFAKVGSILPERLGGLSDYEKAQWGKQR